MSKPWIVDFRSWVENHGTHASIIKQIGHLETLRRNWRPSPRQLEVPHSWMLTDEELHAPLCYLDSKYELLAGIFLQYVQDQISVIDEEDIQARYSDPECTLVDFQLQTSRFFVPKDTPFKIEPTGRGTSYSRLNFISLVLFNDPETIPDQLIGGCLIGAPGCWLLNEPQYRFAPQLSSSIHPSPDFALVRNPIIPWTTEGKTAHKILPVSVGRPALVIGTRSESNLNSTQSTDESPIKLICTSAQQSLDTLVQAWRIRHNYTSSSPMDVAMPPWLFTFGIICNAHSITILALIPLFDPSHPDVRYVCKTVDDIPFGALEEPFSGVSDNIQSRLMERIRLLTAMTTISKHAFRLCDIFDDPFLWPPPTAVLKADEAENHPIPPGAEPDLDLETRVLGEYERYEGSSWGRKTPPSRDVRSDDSNEAGEV